MSRAVFLDRDGTIIKEKNYLRRVEELEIFSGAGAALGRLCRAGFKLFIVSNQSGVGRGYFTLAEVGKVNEYLLSELAREGARFERIYIAPEAPNAPSRGRKPSPQFLWDARDECGVRKCLLVRTGYGAELERTSPNKLKAAAVVDDLHAASQWILDST
jgi:D-glycero-D-manno-heptose 1,7-bisphosphate phosphatase